MTAFYDLHRLQHAISRSIVLFCSTPVILTVVEIESRHKNTPLLDIE